MYSKVLVSCLIFLIINTVSGSETIKLQVDINEISDTYIIINITGPLVSEGKKFGSIRVVNQQLEDLSNNGEEDHNKTKVNGKMKKKILTELRQSDHFFQQIQLVNLKPDQFYLINITGLYGDKSLPVDLFNVKTKSSSLIKMKDQPIVLYFDGANATDYFVQVSLIKSSYLQQTADCILDVKMSSCFGSKLPLPDLDKGEKYLIKLWYINDKGQESGVKTIEHYG